MDDTVLPFDNVTTQLHEGDCVYLFTDGYADQFGGPKEKLMRKQFEEVLIANSDKTMPRNKTSFEKHTIIGQCDLGEWMM